MYGCVSCALLKVPGQKGNALIFSRPSACHWGCVHLEKGLPFCSLHKGFILLLAVSLSPSTVLGTQ